MTAPWRAWPREHCLSTTPRLRPRLHANSSNGQTSRTSALSTPPYRAGRRARSMARSPSCAVASRPTSIRQALSTTFAQAVTLLGDSGSGQLCKMVNQICIAGLVQGLSEAIAFGQAAKLDMKQVLGRYQQRRGPKLANGKPRRHHDRRQIRLRFRRRLDAQRPWAWCLAKPSAMARACRLPPWLISFMPMCSKWAAIAGIRPA